jgi:hypothetical protein
MSNLRDRSGNVKLGRFCVLPSCFGGGRDILVLMTTRRFPPPWSVEELDALLCQIESRIKKTPALGLGSFCTQTKSGARGVGGMGESARLVVTLAGRLF